MKEVYVVNCCRTAVQAPFGGSLKDTPATELGTVVVKRLNRAGVKPNRWTS